MADWLSKHCPNRKRLLDGVPVVYKEYMAMSSGSPEDSEIRHADATALEAIALLIGRSIDREQSLVEWIEDNNQTYPSDPEGWFGVCTAAGWLVVQTYFREFVANGGE
ncbi:hypothetical protein [Rhodococcus sp. BH5]|uniref:hypothetical protein n=1 Tax=Rhodococcus sp. BH5 TaxID=2871702 RepID=UPI0022CD2FAC|nr:hypothetical protein [Rhodococcus sp. BH5]MCZ9633413.1 hypothetical protein [Rhodococcus sp. BH5]